MMSAVVNAPRVARRLASRLWRGRRSDPPWVRPALLFILLAAAALYLWDLSASGWANAYYSAAAQAASSNWKAFFFGSFDASNAITVDKTPASLWVMGLSVRLFGLSSWAILVPEALAGVATVGMVFATVRRVSRPAAGLIAAVVTALTPAAVLMFRFNNPDALLVLLLVAAAYAMVRAQEHAETRWLVLASALVGFGFLAKMLQALLVVPAFALAYLITAPTTFRRRVRQAVIAIATVLVAGGWWVAIVELWPAASRPFIGGSQTNSVLDLMFGYNGLGRLNGNEVGSVIAGGGQGNAGAWGDPGWTRMFGGEAGTQASWLLPTALVLLAAGLWWTRRAQRTDRLRASYLMWGGWLVTTVLVFSFMQGIFHAYYTVALAPLIGAVVGLGAFDGWTRRTTPPGRAMLALSLALTAVWSWELLSRTPDWEPWLRSMVLVGGLATSAAILGANRLTRSLVAGVAALALVVGVAGPAAYALETAGTPHTGAIPTAGPSGSVQGGFGPGRGFGRGGLPAGQNGFRPVVRQDGVRVPIPAPQGGIGTRFVQNGGAGNPQGGNLGGLLDASRPGAALVALLQDNAGGYRWVAAAVGANSAAGYQLAAQEPILAIGGFNGTDPWPTLEEFQAFVASGEVHYFIGGNGPGGGFGGRDAGSSDIASWVAATFSSTTVDGVTIYDLSS
jgi:4-amino-4-deoxy-L-arabinose transferase-like glycosyltransferase